MSNAAGLRVVIAGGGTGGHVYPGIAVARELMQRRPDTVIVFAGTVQGIETRVVPREGFPLEVVRTAGLKGKSPGAFARSLALFPVSARDAWRVISKHVPDLVMGLGGYSSGPLVLIAALRGIPTLLLEQNVHPGLTNRVLAPFVRAAAVSFDTALRAFGQKGFVSGNPVRPEFFQDDPGPPPGTRADTCHVLIVGGSQGAHAINAAFVSAAPALSTIRPRLVVTHQAGQRDVGLVSDAYRQAGIEARVESYLEPMSREMANADIIVCRSGATTLAELAAVGRPGILVPLPTATDDHQRWNAEVFVGAGAAEMILQSELLGSTLTRYLALLAADRLRCSQMARAARSLARPDAARVIVDRALQLVGS